MINRRSAIKILGGAGLVSVVPFPVNVSGKVLFPADDPAKKRELFAYRSFWPEFGAMKQFHEAGVNTVCIFAANTNNSLGKPYSLYPPVWRWFGKYDFESLNKQYDDVLAVNPDAEFICMIDLNSPVWLINQLSSECDSFNMLSCACSNPRWINEVSAYLEAVVKHMETWYGDRVKAYLLACGMTDEWMDYSQNIAGRNKTQAWKKWLKNHGKPEIAIPAFERIDKASFDNLIRDPETEQDIIDYAHFSGDLIVDTVLNFARITRSLIPKHRQIGMFFGYILELTKSRMVSCGHLEYERLYSSPYIDFYISPGTYGDRPMGGGSGFMVPNGTRVLNGKGFLHEIDHRTPTYNVELDEFVSIQWMVPWKDQAETSAGLKREFSLATINNTSLWCFDMWGGVFKTTETLKIIEHSKRIWDQFTSESYRSLAEVALIADPQSARYLNDRNDTVQKIYQQTRNKLNRMGAPFEVFSFNDLPRADLSNYKLIIFPGLFELTPEKQETLNNYVFNNNRSVLFIYTPGISDGKNLNTARVKELTGIDFNTPGVNKIQRTGWTSFYIPDYETLTPQILKKVATEAKVTVYCQDEVPVYANERLVAIHMAIGGEKAITLPVPCKNIRELFSGEVIKVKNKKFSYKFSTPDTALFEILL